MMAAGQRLGSYTLAAPLGAGGMGEVWKALDTRLGREVAVKVLPEARSADPDRQRRFEQEARAASALNHPNVLTLLDVGSHEGAPFIVFELLEGETLRARLAHGPLGERRSIDFAGQLARGLAAAHAKGIVHRDLKPENLFLTRDGGLKILDFGLAKLHADEREPLEPSAATDSHITDPGTRLGTVGYMSPEQAQGREADHRSDIFAFGLVLHEMLSGERAFRRPTPAETLTAILHEEPGQLSSTGRPVSPALERLVRRCLEKSPAERFQSARDLGFALEALSAGPTAAPAQVAPRRAPGISWRRLAASLAVVGAASTAAYWLGSRSAPTRFPVYEQLTSDRGLVTGARFSRDGTMVLYSAAWFARPLELFVRRLESADIGRLDLPPAKLLSISSKGEAAILLTKDREVLAAEGTLARVPLTGGTPRPLLDDVAEADWAPDGENMCVRRRVAGEWHIEYPIGNVLLRERAVFPRVSPDGNLVAAQDQQGDIVVLDRSGHRRSLGGRDLFVFGLAWGPSGHEVWFTGGPGAMARALWAVDLAGNRRLLARAPGSLTVFDVASDGRALVLTGFARSGTRARGPDQEGELEIAAPLRSRPVGFSADGRSVLIHNYAATLGRSRLGYVDEEEARLARSDGSSIVRLGKGRPLALSPDGAWALCRQGLPARLVELPTGAGEPREWPLGSLQPDGAMGPAAWSPDGRVLFVVAQERGQRQRVFARRAGDPAWLPVTPEGVVGEGVLVPSPDGRRVALVGRDRSIWLYDVEGGAAVELADTRGLAVVHWTADSRALYVKTPERVPAVLERLDLGTGRRRALTRLMPEDNADVVGIDPIHFTANGASYVYGYSRARPDLFLVSGLE